MSVLNWHAIESTGNVAGELRWSATPEITYSLEITAGGTLVEFTARSATGVSARRMRMAPIGEMQRTLRHHAADSAAATTQLPSVLDITIEGATYRIPFGPRHPARKAMERVAADFTAKRPDEKYAAMAAMYVELLDQGEKRPVVVLAERLNLSDKTVRNYLFTARERGFLTSAGRGRSGGQLTHKAKEMLSGNDQAS